LDPPQAPSTPSPSVLGGGGVWCVCGGGGVRYVPRRAGVGTQNGRLEFRGRGNGRVGCQQFPTSRAGEGSSGARLPSDVSRVLHWSPLPLRSAPPPPPPPPPKAPPKERPPPPPKASSKANPFPPLPRQLLLRLFLRRNHRRRHLPRSPPRGRSAPLLFAPSRARRRVQHRSEWKVFFVILKFLWMTGWLRLRESKSPHINNSRIRPSVPRSTVTRDLPCCAVFVFPP